MVGRPWFLRAVRRVGAGAGVGALLATTLALGPGVAPARADPDRADGATSAAPLTGRVGHLPGRARPRDTAPLRVQILHLSPATLPVQGDLTVRGIVTNRTDEVWSSIRLYAFLGGDAPAMTTRGELAAAMDEPYDADVGERIVNEGETAGEVETLEPGASAPFEVVVPGSALEVTGGGVYWFGIHALGQSTSNPPDTFADGRARTFLSYVPPRVGTPVRAALVLPLIRTLKFRGDGTLDEEPKWTRSLSARGRLRDLLAFGTAAGEAGVPVSWVVDPALLDGVRRLALGNPPHSLGPSERPGEPATDAPSSSSGSPSASPTDDATAPAGDPESPEPDEAEPQAPPATPSARAAAAWLAALPDATDGNEVLTLPYGNLDVPATLAQDPRLLDVSLAQRSRVLTELDLEPDPVLAAPGGLLDTASIEAAGVDTTTLVGEALLPGVTDPVVQLDGHELVVTAAGAGEGSPGPGPSITSVGLRQRILAEAAVRALRADQPPLVVLLPTDWGLDSAADFFRGLDVDWLDVSTLSDLRAATPAEPITTDDVDYPAPLRRRQLPPALFAAVDDLIASAETLQKVLGDNNEIAGQVTEQALSVLSYGSRARDEQVRARGRVAAARGWVSSQLDQVRISASSGVTLASDSGTFVVTLSNDLDQTVTVSVRATSDPGLTVADPDPVELAPGGRTNVLLEAHATGNGVHNVTLRVTDADGVPLGPSDELPIRSAQVSDVIWLIMGSGVAILFVAIAIRLVRRVRGGRRGARLEAA